MDKKTFLRINSEYPRIFRVTGANQNARTLLSTDLVNTNINYFDVFCDDFLWLVPVSPNYKKSTCPAKFAWDLNIIVIFINVIIIIIIYPRQINILLSCHFWCFLTCNNSFFFLIRILCSSYKLESLNLAGHNQLTVEGFSVSKTDWWRGCLCYHHHHHRHHHTL